MNWLVLAYFVFALSSFLLFLYSLNIIYLSTVYLLNWKNIDNCGSLQKVDTTLASGLPVITTQIPIFNEAGVIEQTLLSVANIDYPKKKHQIQILDDSSDDTSIARVKEVVNVLEEKGYWVQHLFREHRSGYKAGALNDAMSQAQGEFLFILDADFRPQPDVIRTLLPYLLEDKDLAYVQVRWGYRNYASSLLTKVQALAIDGHFIVEQYTRSLLGFVSHFNGTAGVWRKSAVIDSNMWSTDIVSEDVAISYEAYLRKWRSAYIPEYVIDGEIPDRVSAYRSQQARWAVGTIQVAKKYLLRIFRSSEKLGTKVQAFFHLTQYTINIWVLLNIICIGLILSFGSNGYSPALLLGFTFLIFSLSGPLLLYFCAYCVPRKRYLDFLVQVGPFLALSGGMALGNARAVLLGLFSNRVEFVRTPKASQVNVSAETRKYTKGVVAEVVWGLFCIYSAILAVNNQSFLLAYFLASSAAGTAWIGLASFKESRSWGSTFRIGLFGVILKRTVITLLCLVVVLAIGPIYVLMFGEYAIGDEKAKYRVFVDRKSVGLAPDPAEFAEAVIQVYAARAWNYKGAFSAHTWIATKAEAEQQYTVAQIKGWLYTQENESPLVIERDVPDLTWMGNAPVLLADIRGDRATLLVARVRRASLEYPYSATYRTWPGPNSNTFTAYVANQVPELQLDLPSNAIGKDYVHRWASFHTFGQGKNFDLSLGRGLLGLKLGTEVGLEINVLTLNVQFDVDDLRIDYAGVGRH